MKTWHEISQPPQNDVILTFMGPLGDAHETIDRWRTEAEATSRQLKAASK